MIASSATAPRKYYIKARGTSTARRHVYASVRDNDGLGALDCEDGTVATGALIERTQALGNRLAAGTYYLGLASQSADRRRVPDLVPESGRTAAERRGVPHLRHRPRSTSAVTAGRDYYLVVKGAASTSGTYGLTITDLDAVRHDELRRGQRRPDCARRVPRLQRHRRRLGHYAGPERRPSTWAARSTRSTS